MTARQSSISQALLEKAVSRLRPIEREVLLMSARDGWSCDRIAEELGIPVEAARRHLASALAQLDRAIERQQLPWWRRR